MASNDPIDPQQLERLKPELFELVKLAVRETRMPYAAMLVDKQTGVVIAKDFNTSLQSFDPSDQDTVSLIRKAKRALETNDLSHTYVFSFFEPPLLCFDIAMFAQIANFAWCINTADAPEGHYLITEYTPAVYAQKHPGEIAVTAGYQQDEALELFKSLNLSSMDVPKGYRL
jgi:tRNA(Arg) A34 adenosine deaminase TadA